MYLCIFLRAPIGVVLEVAQSGMLQAAEAGKLVGTTRESPEQPDPVLAGSWSHQGQPCYPKIHARALWLPFSFLPLTLKYAAFLAISTKNPSPPRPKGILTLAPCFWPDGDRLQASWFK